MTAGELMPAANMWWRLVRRGRGGPCDHDGPDAGLAGVGSFREGGEEGEVRPFPLGWCYAAGVGHPLASGVEVLPLALGG